MKDYQEIFTRWSAVSTEELSQIDDAGARVELALRTKSPIHVQNAIDNMDMDYYNVFSMIPLLELGDFAENVSKFDSTFIATLLLCSNMQSVLEPDVLLYAVNKLGSVATGFLQKITQHLSLLQHKVLQRNSKAYLQLLRFHFSDFTIAYLNYKWAGRQMSDNSLLKLQSNLLNTLFEQNEPYSQFDKDLIVSVLHDHPRYVETINWSKRLDLVDVNNDENWEWLYGLRCEGLIDYSCVRVNALLAQEVPRFFKLMHKDTIQSADQSFARAGMRENVLRAVERLNLSNYLEDKYREFPQETFKNLVRVGILDLNDCNANNRESFLKGLQTRDAYNYFKENKDIQSLKYLTLRQYYREEIDYYKKYLSEDEQREFISLVLDIVYNESEDKYVNLLSEMLMDERVTMLYDKGLLLPIVQYLTETFKSSITSYKSNKMLKNLLSEEEYNEHFSKIQEQERLEQIKRDEERTAKLIVQVNEMYNECTNFAELEEVYTKLCSDWRMDKKIVKRALADHVMKHQDDWEQNANFANLQCILWQEKLITLDAFRESLGTSLEGGVA